MPRRGQTKVTPKMEEAMLLAIGAGTPYRHAAAIAGISEDTFDRHRKRNADFADAIKKAEGNAVASKLARIGQAATEHWQAAAWWLERKYPQEFGKTVQENQITGKDGGALTIKVVYADDHPDAS